MKKYFFSLSLLGLIISYQGWAGMKETQEFSRLLREYFFAQHSLHQDNRSLFYREFFIDQFDHIQKSQVVWKEIEQTINDFEIEFPSPDKDRQNFQHPIYTKQDPKLLDFYERVYVQDKNNKDILSDPQFCYLRERHQARNKHHSEKKGLGLGGFNFDSLMDDIEDIHQNLAEMNKIDQDNKLKNEYIKKQKNFSTLIDDIYFRTINDFDQYQKISSQVLHGRELAVETTIKNLDSLYLAGKNFYQYIKQKEVALLADKIIDGDTLKGNIIYLELVSQDMIEFSQKTLYPELQKYQGKNADVVKRKEDLIEKLAGVHEKMEYLIKLLKKYEEP